MFRLILISTFAALCVGQSYNRDPKYAAILSEQRYLAGGQFGSAYTQEDGINFKEETDNEGNRRGSYEYVDPDGNVRKVSYVAGKNGFQATGDHLPQAPPAPPQAAPQPQYQGSQPQVRDPYDTSDQYDDGSYDERWNNPGFRGEGQQKFASRPGPPPAPVNYNYQASAPQYQPPQEPAHRQQNYNVPQVNYQDTTPSPNRFYPKGKLNLSRTPDGFQYSFNKA